MEASTENKNKRPIDRFLNLFTEVHRGEAATVLLMALNIFLILLAYYIIKPVREALILAVPRGAELKAYAAAGQAILLLLVAVPLYARLAGTLARRRLLNSVNLFFIANLLLFYFALTVFGPGQTWLGLMFFLWVGIFNLMVPAQFWSLANDIYTPGEGKRLFVLVAFGASLGAAAGGLITGWLIEPLGLNQLLLVSAGVLVASTLLTNLVDSRERERAKAKTKETVAEAPLSKKGAYGLVFKTRYLLLIALLMMFLNWVNTNGEFILGNIVGDTYKLQAVEQLGAGAPQDQIDAYVGSHIGKFYADFFTVVNILGLLIQLLLVSRIIKYLGIRVALVILPLISLVGYSLLAFLPILGVIRWAKTAENATDYSLQNTVRQALFLPTTREEKYKAKQAIDTFFWRAGDLLSAALVYVGLNLLSLTNKGFALFNLGLVLVWLLLAFKIGRRYQQMTRDQAKE